MAREDRSPEFIGVLGFFIATCTLLVFLRVYCKLVIVKNFAADDYFSVLTLASFLVFCTFALMGIQNGTGKRRHLIPEEKFPNGMKWWWLCEPTYVFTNICLKMSIGIFLLRIATQPVHRMILWASLVSIQIYSLFFFLLFTFQCWPVSHFWNQFRGGKGHCMDSKIIVNSFYGYSALSCVTDWTFSIVPIFIVQGLQMNRKKKMTVGVILAFCAIGSTATIVRLPFINGLNDIPDFLYSTIDVAIWSTCETGIGLGASAVATLRPLMRQVLGDSTNGNSGHKQSRGWTATHPTRSGYLAHSSNVDEIPLSARDAKLANIQIRDSRDQSPSGSTAGLRDWELEKEGKKTPIGSLPAAGNIMKTVQITQS